MGWFWMVGFGLLIRFRGEGSLFLAPDTKIFYSPFTFSSSFAKGFVFITRNTKDFYAFEMEMVNPF